MAEISELGRNIEECLSATGLYKEDVSGHKKKMLRYRSKTGIPFCIGRREKKTGRFWFSSTPSIHKEIEDSGYELTKSTPKLKGTTKGDTGIGRNSNTDAFPEFKGAVIYWVHITSAEQAKFIAAKM